eukprot:GABU01004125.1.p1 GENE.GABU01004125.1~~GABU01004125.1.p1  ORF type:complete len:109 (-),score=12.15 GABU01004125.1:209-535(-)
MLDKKLKMHKRATTCGQSLKDLVSKRRAAAIDEDNTESQVQPSEPLDMVLELSTESVGLPVKLVRTSLLQHHGSLHRGVSGPNQQQLCSVEPVSRKLLPRERSSRQMS